MGGEPLARSERAVKVCETAGPPVVYLPPDDIVHEALVPAAGQSFCEWKGSASYYDVVAGGHVAERAAWAYRTPTEPFAAIRDWVAFYPALVECRLGDERVLPQPRRLLRRLGDGRGLRPVQGRAGQPRLVSGRGRRSLAAHQAPDGAHQLIDLRVRLRGALAFANQAVTGVAVEQAE